MSKLSSYYDLSQKIYKKYKPKFTWEDYNVAAIFTQTSNIKSCWLSICC